MTEAQRLTPEDVRRRLAFDVARLRSAAERLEGVDALLRRLRSQLQQRAQQLAGQGQSRVEPELGGSGTVMLRYAQAQATAEIARRAALGEVLRHAHALALIASMAVGRWIFALASLRSGPQPRGVLRGHIDAGRVAYRLLALFSPGEELRRGCGQLTSAAVVRELIHPDDAELVDEQLEEGLFRGRQASAAGSEEEAVATASRALRAAARLLESMAAEAEPAARELLAEAEGVEARVEAALFAPVARPRRS
jgi:hypothetical protein